MKKTSCAFFDVDGTILNTRSMFNFVEYVSDRHFSHRNEFHTYYRHLYQMICSQANRSDVNRFYYSFLKELKVDFVASLGQEWFSNVSGTDGFYNKAVLCKLIKHKQEGTNVILVTGSFIQILEPLVKKLGIDAALCSTPEIKDGVFTGELTGLPCIGEGKAAAILRYAQNNAVDLGMCVAYGDDQTDLPMLNAVGHGELVQASQIYRDEFDEIVKRAKRL